MRLAKTLESLPFLCLITARAKSIILSLQYPCASTDWNGPFKYRARSMSCIIKSVTTSTSFILELNLLVLLKSMFITPLIHIIHLQVVEPQGYIVL